MKRSAKGAYRQAQWRERLARQAHSGQSVAAFCKSEGIATPTFYWWRSRFAGGEGKAVRPREDAPFIDLGALDADTTSGAGFDIRLDLPGGIVLTIARR